jgi:hypothetical protein
MLKTENKKYKTLNSLHILILLSLSLTMGCQTFKYESRFMQQFQTKGAELRKTAAELRLEINDLAGVFEGTIEQAADEVIAQSEDNDISRHALLWKINGIPSAFLALFQPDPGVAFIDTWAFSLQMVDYFKNGPGKTDFGQWHHIVLVASQKLELLVTKLGERMSADGNVKPTRDKIKIWVRDNPIERDFIYRNTTVPVIGSMLGAEEMGAFQTVGSIGVTVEEVSYRMGVYMNLLTKQARWQAELVMKGTDDKPSLQDGLVAIDELGSFINRMEPVLEQIPDLIVRERKAILKAIQKERIEVLANINQQRLDILNYLTGVQLSITKDLINERRIIMDILLSERKNVLESIDEQRIATLTEIESASNRVVDKVLDQSKPLIDYIFIRVLQILAVLLVSGVIGAAILIRLKGKRKPSVNRA